MRPRIGEPTVLVYRECREGCWCATGEGDRHPLCAEHGLPMLPGAAPEGRNAYGVDALEHRRLRGLAFNGTLLNEVEAVREVQASRRPGVTAALVTRWQMEPDRYYSEEEIRALERSVAEVT